MSDALTRLVNFGAHYALFFAIFTALAFLARGTEIFRWRPKLAHSAATNLAFVGFNTGAAIIVYYLVLPVSSLYEFLNVPQLPAALWANVPLPIAGLIALLVYDFNLYWVHRYLHESWIWPIHAVHHSDTQLHFLSWSRAHFLETAVLSASLLVMGSWLGLKFHEIFMLGYIKAVHQYYVHANLDWGHGPLKHIIASPRFHRWHHADVKEAYDKNFASIFPFYDILFGTYYCPGPAKDVPTGFENNPGDHVVPLIAFPFKEWARMLSNRFGGQRADKQIAAE
ncbi:MAG: sterol desaturase family protein [Pseudomonadota bacterium]